MAKFEIKKRNNGEFQFNLKAPKGEVILSSEEYKSKTSCIVGINSVKTNAAYNEKYELKTSNNGKWFFNLKATNGRVIGTSEIYSSAAVETIG